LTADAEATLRREAILTADTFRIAVICTGNRFRSPLVEHVLRRETQGLPVEIESFGLLDLRSAPVLPELEEHAAAAGVDVSGHRSRRLPADSLSDADLVVGFERDHVAHAVVRAKSQLERTFTLPELVGLLEEMPAPRGSGNVIADARASVARAAAQRVDPRRGRVPEIQDPLGQTPAVVADIAADVSALSVRLAAALFGQEPR
jgi:protein-tyrosine phosphatase